MQCLVCDSLREYAGLPLAIIIMHVTRLCIRLRRLRLLFGCVYVCVCVCLRVSCGRCDCVTAVRVQHGIRPYGPGHTKNYRLHEVHMYKIKYVCVWYNINSYAAGVLAVALIILQRCAMLQCSRFMIWNTTLLVTIFTHEHKCPYRAIVNKQ